MALRKTAALLLAVMTLIAAGCSEQQVERENSGIMASEFVSGSPLASAFTDSRAEGMKGVAESNELKLLADDQTGAVAVLHKKSGAVWHSNPAARDQDMIASGINKDLLSSQLKIEFYNRFGQNNSVNTYTDSTVHKQIRAEMIPGGVKMSYMFGTSKKTIDDMPMKISKERLEELFMSKLDNTGQRALKIAYTEDKKTGVYVRSDGALTGLQLDRALKAMEEAGYTEDDLQLDIEENNLDQVKPEPRIFLAAIEYTLDGDSLVVNVPSSEIRYPEEYPIGTVSLLSYFGAGGLEDEGSLFVPDGSGALIHFNNGKTRYAAYQQPIYGSDLTIERVDSAAQTKDARLPVFGIIRENAAMLGIIEEGEAASTISADISGKLNSYNYVYPTFTVLNKGELTLFANEQQRSLPRYQENPTKSDLTVRYAFLDSQEASYQGMAAYYQRYLTAKGGLPQKSYDADSSTDMPFYLKLIGSIDKQKHFAGIPYRSLEPLTTFEQAQTIVSQMLERGIGGIRLQYAGWFNGGLDHRVPDQIKVDDAVGGSKELKALIQYGDEAGVTVFPDLALLIARTGKSFNENKEAARTLRSVPAEMYPLDLALNRRDRNKSPSYVISPRLIGDYVDAMLDDFVKYRTGGISLRDLASVLNSDFRKNNQIDRVESKHISVKALESISGENLRIMADGGNAYALPYLSDIINAPMSSSNFKIADESIPFYQMVVRGHLDYTGEPYNLTGYTDSRQYLLKTLEYGSGLYFEWIHEPNYKVMETDYTNLYSVHYEVWLDMASDIYKEANAFLRTVHNERITSHEKLQEGVYKTIYESGYVIVNYNRDPVTVEGKTIEAASYTTGGGRS